MEYPLPRGYTVLRNTLENSKKEVLAKHTLTSRNHLRFLVDEN